MCTEMRAKIKPCERQLRGPLEPIGKQQGLLGMVHQPHPDWPDDERKLGVRCRPEIREGVVCLKMEMRNET